MFVLYYTICMFHYIICIVYYIVYLEAYDVTGGSSAAAAEGAGEVANRAHDECANIDIFIQI